MSNGEQRKDKVFISVKKRKSRECVRLGQFLNHCHSAPNLCGAGHFQDNCLNLSFSQCSTLSRRWKVGWGQKEWILFLFSFLSTSSLYPLPQQWLWFSFVLIFFFLKKLPSPSVHNPNLCPFTPSLRDISCFLLLLSLAKLNAFFCYLALQHKHMKMPRLIRSIEMLHVVLVFLNKF